MRISFNYATSLKAIDGSSLYPYISVFHLLSILIGDQLQPDLLLKTNKNSFDAL